MIRDFQPEDIEAVHAIHKSQKFDYNLPELSSPLILVKKVRVEGGRVVAAMFLRIAAEAYLLCEGGPVAKGRAVEELQPEIDRAAWEKGLDDYFCVVPPEIADSFAPALEKMGWTAIRPWPMWQRELNAVSAETSR